MSAPYLKSINLTANQKEVFEGFKQFVEDDSLSVFILKGYAGTGKTTLIRFFIERLKDQNLSYALLASTGRAAKIVSNATGTKASTVHSQIYSLKDFNQDLEEVVRKEKETGIDSTGQLYLTFELTTVMPSANQKFYIIDEASMISDAPDPNANQAVFGSGKLLTDLMQYDKNGKFVFVGDECQLPPIWQDFSPALSAGYFRNNFNIKAVEYSLTDIVRQQEDNSIIQASHALRELYENPPQVRWGKLPLSQYKHIQVHPDFLSLIRNYIQQVKGRNYDHTTFIASSNAKCSKANALIRNSLQMRPTLQVGDLLLVTQNNLISGFMNGDMVVVEQIKTSRYQRAQLTFQMVELRELVTNRRYTQLLIENILYGGMTNLSLEQQKSLYIDFYLRLRDEGIKQKDLAFRERLNTDPYLNALRCVFGYAITCHKAQGGEWNEVFVDIPRNLTLESKPSGYQWIYTAVTRAREKLHIVKDFFIT